MLNKNKSLKPSERTFQTLQLLPGVVWSDLSCSYQLSLLSLRETFFTVFEKERKIWEIGCKCFYLYCIPPIHIHITIHMKKKKTNNVFVVQCNCLIRWPEFFVYIHVHLHLSIYLHILVYVCTYNRCLLSLSRVH